MRAEDTQLCVARDVDKESKDLPNEIYLIPESDDEHGNYWAWCDTPTPTDEHVEEEAVKYIRADKQDV